jgi:V8-like Glu-specific endopeptidase
MGGNETLAELVAAVTAAARAYDADRAEQAVERLVAHIRENIAIKPSAYVRELEAAVNAFDRQRAGELCDLLTAHLRTRAKPYPLTESRKILGTLRRKRYFDLLVSVADVLIQTGQDAPNIRRQYAQGLLDLGRITAGLDVLQVLEQDCLKASDEAELAETRGLMGRAHKQMYMDAAAARRPGSILRQRLEEAVTDYAGVYTAKQDRQDHLWHGINTVALLERAKRDRVKLTGKFPDVTATAHAILRQIASKKQPDLWDLASAGEAALALKDYRQALDWILRYTAESTGADAFEYASTLRQFEEVWKLDDGRKEQAQILHLLRAALLRQEGGRVEITDPARNLATAAALEEDANFEKVLGVDRYRTFQWYRTGLDRASGVAQIRDRFGNGHGTGFLVRGADVHDRFGPDWVVVTNAHVVSDDPAEQRATPAALSPESARIRFEAKDPGREFEVDSILFSSPRTELDCTILGLRSSPAHDKPYPIARHLPLLDKNQRVYVIGHPRGGGLSYSIDDNLLLDHEQPRVHYRAPTEGGSSGSPVFTQEWDLLALHHAGGMNMKKLNGKPGTYPANEGLYFQSIREAVAARLG